MEYKLKNTESLYCIPETNIVNQLYFNLKSKKKKNPSKFIFPFVNQEDLFIPVMSFIVFKILFSKDINLFIYLAVLELSCGHVGTSQHHAGSFVVHRLSTCDTQAPDHTVS